MVQRVTYRGSVKPRWRDRIPIQVRRDVSRACSLESRPSSNKLRGYLFIPHHLPPPPYLGKKIYPLFRVLVTIGSYNKHPHFRAFSGNLTAYTAANYSSPPPPHSRENGHTHAAPWCIRVGAGRWIDIKFVVYYIHVVPRRGLKDLKSVSRFRIHEHFGGYRYNKVYLYAQLASCLSQWKFK